MRRIILDRTDRLHRMAPETVSSDRLVARLDKRLIKVVDLAAIDCGPHPDFAPPPLSASDLSARPDTQTNRKFCELVACYYEQRFGVHLNPEKEVLPVPGAAAAMNLLTLAFVEPGDLVLVPDPARPTYRNAVALSGGATQSYYLYDRNNYIPDCRMIANTLAGKTKLWFVGYPHDPSTALADRDLFLEIIRLARRRNILVVFDGMYTWLNDSGPNHTGLLVDERACAVGIEVISFDHNFGLGRLNLAVITGNKEAVAGAKFLAESVNLLPSSACLKTGIWALEHADLLLAVRRRLLDASREALTTALRELGFAFRAREGLPFLWLTVPRRYTSLGFARRLLRRSGIKTMPGTVFGEQGEGYARVSLHADVEKTVLAVNKLAEFGRFWHARRPE